MRAAEESRRLTLTLWTNEAALAQCADCCGVDRIGVDLEVLGKSQRQSRIGNWISDHQLEDIYSVRQAVEHAELFARVNAFHSGTEGEVQRLLEAGVEVLMLPYFKYAWQVHDFVETVANRASVIPLLETIEAVDELPSIVTLPGLTEIHIGLTDLSLSMGLESRFGCLGTPVIEQIADAVHGAGLALGLGSLGRAHDRRLPIHSDLMFAQMARFGATSALLGRSFLGQGLDRPAFTRELRKVRENWSWWNEQPEQEIKNATAELLSHLSNAYTQTS